MNSLSRCSVIVALIAALTSPALNAAENVFRDKLASGGEGPEMVRIPAGEFVMGGGDGKTWLNGSEVPRHKVTIRKPFALGRYELTRSQYERFVKATERPTVSKCRAYERDAFAPRGNWASPGFEQQDDHPVVCINLEDARDYLSWLSKETGAHYRLASEAEWEYAARAGTTTRYIGGDKLEDVCRFGNVWDRDAKGGPFASRTPCSDGYSRTSPVGHFPPNAWGLYDMTGNVREILEDCFVENYNGAPTDGSAWIQRTCEIFARRGGGWGTEGEYLRVAFRAMFLWEEQDDSTGLRVARDLD